MLIEDVYQQILAAKRPIDFFGEVSSADQLKKKYRTLARKLHPDLVSKSEEYKAQEAFGKLGEIYQRAKDELEKGIYAITDCIELYKNMQPLFDEIEINGKSHKFYERVVEGDVADIYKGVSDGIIFLKVPRDADDSDLLDNEFEVLSGNRHNSLPYVEKKIIVNGSSAIIMREIEGLSMPEYMKDFPQGVPALHVAWMMERLLSVVGFLHNNKIVHENIRPDHVIIDDDTHNVSLCGFSWCIPNADTSDASYKIRYDDGFSAPEVSKEAVVLPSSDIYPLGKIAIQLLGGDIKSNGMPINIDVRIRSFFRKLVNENFKERPNDAWALWHQLRSIRLEVFGPKRFEKVIKNKRGTL